MKKDKRPLHLTASDYLASGRDGLNQQVANARWQLMLAVQRKVPEFFARLRNDVYPDFARLTKPGYWHTGGSFSIWQSRSDPDRHLTPILMEWARRFHVEEETWILEGALKTLSTWHKLARCREDLEIHGFRKPVCVSGLIRDRERAFHFEDEGWDPTMISFAGWRVNVREGFEAAIKRHQQQMLELIKERGGLPAVVRSSEEHFEWLALYQFANATLESIAKIPPYRDKTTIFKGVHQAARLSRMSIRAKRRKLKSH